MSRARTEQKLRYARILLAELEGYKHATSNDDWENAHQEAFFYHLAGACENVLHEINDAYRLHIPLTKVREDAVKRALNGVSSVALDQYCALRQDGSSWLSLLFELRNHGAHRGRVRKVVHASTNERLDNEFIDPRTGTPQAVYPQTKCGDMMYSMLDDAVKLIESCRSTDERLQNADQ